jgi:protein-tyrosine sulfotransferase
MRNPSLQGRRFIFTGGAPRSGTTLIQNMLDSHPDIFGGPEFLHLPDIIATRNKLLESINKQWISEFCSEEEANRLTVNYIEKLLLPLADRHGAKLLSEKTPHNALIFVELLELFPNARFIHVVRDPRAVISSMLQVGRRAKKQGRKLQKFTRYVSDAIDHVKKCLQGGFTAQRQSPEQVITVVYERLVRNPQAETKRLCHFLGIEWVEQMVTPSQKEHLGEKAITSAKTWYTPKTYNRDPHPAEIKKWKSQLSTLQQARISLAFQDFSELSELGYDFSIDQVPHSIRWAAHLMSKSPQRPFISRLASPLAKINVLKY